MLKFDPSLVTFQFIKVKSISTGMGGCIRFLDEEKTTDAKDVFITKDIPIICAASWKKLHKTSSYFKPVEACACLYDGNVIAIEKSTFGNRTYIDPLTQEIHEWIPNMYKLYDEIIDMCEGSDMYFDGAYIYGFEGTVENAIADGEWISEKGNFRAVTSNCISMNKIGFVSNVYVEVRTSVAYVAANNEYNITAPVWKNLGSVGSSNLKKAADSTDMINISNRFDEIDDKLLVNINFALAAAGALSKLFGYRSIEPLRLPHLMLMLRTVNLPNVPAEVRKSTDIGLTFTHCMGWLLGLQRTATTYEQVIKMRSLFRYLTGHGIYARELTTTIRDGMTYDDVPLMTRADAEEGSREFLPLSAYDTRAFG